MIDIYIDGKRVDTDNSIDISISLGIQSMSNIEKSRLPYSKTINLPMTMNNMGIMGDAEQINSATLFNQREHKVRVEADGCTVIDGTPYLIETKLSMNGNKNGGHYVISIIGAGKEWIKYASQTTIRNIDIDFNEKITPAMIQSSWTWEKPVKFLPVQRDGFAVANQNQNIFPPVKILTFEDYHPFVHIKTIIRKIFQNAGYSIKSEFFESELFGSLYMSGNYPRKNVENVKEKMDFKAGRFQDVTAKADSLGRVYADPYRSFNSISNIVDTANPKEIFEGQTIEDVFTNNGCFGKDDDRIVFTPMTEVTAAFEYDITYTTDYYMLSREELKGFNTINLDDGQIRKYKIANRNTDRREVFRAARSYMAIVFGHKEGNSYQFRYEEITTSGNVSKTLKTFDTRTTNITIASNYSVTNPQIWIKRSGEANYTKYNEDWALYDGYVKETGEITVELNVRSSAERLLPSKPKYFDLIFFGGADKGMNLKIHKATTIKPIFAQYPSEGANIEFRDIAAHDNKCLDLINAIKHMFNLLFYTDNTTKQVIIEPREMFYQNTTTIDWSDKIDYSKPITIYEPGGDMEKNIEFEYQTGDGAVTRWNHANQQTLGKWEAKIENKQAKDSSRAYCNTLFTASINYSGDYPDANSASLVQAGDRDIKTSERTEDLNFPPKIVIFEGLEKLPDGQQWGWPANNNKYPLLYFHNPQKNTLCFEDRDGIKGLNKYWKELFKICNNSKYIEANIDLQPKDIEPFITPLQKPQDFRNVFKLKIDGETATYRLLEIKDYDPAEGNSTKCVFMKMV